MPRGRKSYTTEELLEKTMEDIQNYEALLKDAKEKKKQLEKEIHEKELSELQSLIEKSGKSFDDVKAFLAN